MGAILHFNFAAAAAALGSPSPPPAGRLGRVNYGHCLYPAGGPIDRPVIQIHANWPRRTRRRLAAGFVAALSVWPLVAKTINYPGALVGWLESR